MKITTLYLMRQTTKPLAVAMTIGLMVLMAERLVRLLDFTLGKKNSFALVFEMLGYLVPHYLGLAIPAAFFLGLLFGFNRLSKDSEIDAFMASGISLHELTRPLLLMAVAFMGVAVLIFGFIQPQARYAYRAILHSVKNVEVFYLAEEGVFMRNGPRTFILQNLSRRDNAFERIFLFNDKGPQGMETVTARRGSLIEVPGRTRPVLRLHEGIRLEIRGRPSFQPGSLLPRQVTGTFSLVDTPLGSDAPVYFRARGAYEREFTLPELFNRLDNPPKWSTKRAMRAELHSRLVDILIVLILPILAIPFAMGRRRGHRPYRFATALIVLIVFHEIIQQGALGVRHQGYSPYTALWLPFALFTCFSIWRYYQACFLIKSDSFESIFERLNDFGRWFKSYTKRMEGS